MNILAEELDAHGYRVMEEMSHEEIVSFVRKYMRIHNAVTISFVIFNVILVAAFIYLMVISSTPVDSILSYASAGLLLFIVFLLPLHELIHGLVYKLVGAAKVSYHSDWKKMVFYAMADRFVANRSEFYKVAMAPFIIINGLLIIACATLPGPWTWVCWGALIMHTGGCYGDFGLISFFYQHPLKEVVTYDDAAQKKSFFLVKQ